MKYIVKETGEIADLYQNGMYVVVLRFADGGLKPIAKTKVEPYLSPEEIKADEYYKKQQIQIEENQARFKRLTAEMSEDDIDFLRSCFQPRG